MENNNLWTLKNMNINKRTQLCTVHGRVSFIKQCLKKRKFHLFVHKYSFIMGSGLVKVSCGFWGSQILTRPQAYVTCWSMLKQKLSHQNNKQTRCHLTIIHIICSIKNNRFVSGDTPIMNACFNKSPEIIVIKTFVWQ